MKEATVCTAKRVGTMRPLGYTEKGERKTGKEDLVQILLLDSTNLLFEMTFFLLLNFFRFFRMNEQYSQERTMKEAAVHLMMERVREFSLYRVYSEGKRRSETTEIQGERRKEEG